MNFKDNKKLASEAGKKGKPGKHAKTLAWEQLGEYLISEGADRYLFLLKSLDDDKFIDRFEHLLEYFKPKLSRSEIKGEIDGLSDKINTVYGKLQSEPDIPESEPE